MRTDRFHYDLPEESIAQTPAERREDARLLVFHRATGEREHARVAGLARFLQPGDVLVLNDTRVIPARLRARREDAGGRVELLLLHAVAPNEWWTMIKPGRRLRPGASVRLLDHRGAASDFTATIVEKNEAGHGRVHFAGPGDLLDHLGALGEMPLPPYIRPDAARARLDRERYQTVFAREAGSVAAPTAGLHFTGALIEELEAQGVHTCFVTLHVGLGTFAPVKTENVEDHVMHEEHYSVSTTTATEVNQARTEGRRVIAVGTTSLRVLESVAARHEGALVAGAGSTRIFIYPPYKFRMVDGLLTNFHLPGSTLLMLVSAFASPGGTGGIDRLLEVYREAIANGYRFFSYGDAMLVL
jgi:S-adenosylmethionine:tRNA ribosyltransferase-isomerase